MSMSLRTVSLHSRGIQAIGRNLHQSEDGSHRIIDITRADVVELHHSMKATPYQANRTLGVLSVVFAVAHTLGRSR